MDPIPPLIPRGYALEAVPGVPHLDRLLIRLSDGPPYVSREYPGPARSAALSSCVPVWRYFAYSTLAVTLRKIPLEVETASTVDRLRARQSDASAGGARLRRQVRPPERVSTSEHAIEAPRVASAPSDGHLVVDLASSASELVG